MVRRVAMATAVLGAALLAMLGLPGTAGAAVDDVVVADYQMNEAAGASTLIDSSGNGINGIIGADVTTGVNVGGAVAHRFSGSDAVADPSQLDWLADDPRLDPGTREFAITVRMRTSSTHQNLLQKGQSGAAGGYWKIEMSDGPATCLFQGSDGQRGVSTNTAVNDGEWHTIRCERRDDSVAIYLDGEFQRRLDGPTGNISNDWLVAIGGKSSCNPPTVECDYFTGDMDFVTFEAEDTTPPVRLPSGSYDKIEVDGRKVVVRGRANDPDGRPVYRVSTTWDGNKKYSFERQSTPPTFATSFTAQPGAHRVCVTLLDNPTRQPVSLGCKNVTVK